MPSFHLSLIQLNSSSDLNHNIQTILKEMESARKDGADFIALPENAALMAFNKDTLINNAFHQSDHPALGSLRIKAAELGVWLLIGSLAILGDEGKLTNRSFLINPAGEIKGFYDKIHLFDVRLPNGESYRETATFDGGSQGSMVATAFGKIGLSICYDVRFPDLYRQYAQAGADLIFVPAAFTKVTGTAHWHSLLRARAIENGCFIVAPAQCGSHENGRQTYGHSLIIDPWGTILAEGEAKAPCRVMAEIDPRAVQDARQKIPSLTHDRAFTLREFS